MTSVDAAHLTVAQLRARRYAILSILGLDSYDEQTHPDDPISDERDRVWYDELATINDLIDAAASNGAQPTAR